MSDKILGLGNDIVEIERIREAVASHGSPFLTRLFTSKEQEYCQKHKDPVPHLAARFSAKEAIVKAFGSGFGKYASWLDIEILNNPEGKPEVFFTEKVNKHFNHPKVLLSMSHCQLYATAVAIWCAK